MATHSIRSAMFVGLLSGAACVGQAGASPNEMPDCSAVFASSSPFERAGNLGAEASLLGKGPVRYYYRVESGRPRFWVEGRDRRPQAELRYDGKSIRFAKFDSSGRTSMEGDCGSGHTHCRYLLERVLIMIGAQEKRLHSERSSFMSCLRQPLELTQRVIVQEEDQEDQKALLAAVPGLPQIHPGTCIEKLAQKQPTKPAAQQERASNSIWTIPSSFGRSYVLTLQENPGSVEIESRSFFGPMERMSFEAPRGTRASSPRTGSWAKSSGQTQAGCDLDSVSCATMMRRWQKAVLVARRSRWSGGSAFFLFHR